MASIARSAITGCRPIYKPLFGAAAGVLELAKSKLVVQLTRQFA